MNFKRQLPDDHLTITSIDDPDKPGEPNFQRKIRHLQKRGVIPAVGVGFLIIAHDDWCAIYGGGCCDCDPDIVNRITGRKLG